MFSKHGRARFAALAACSFSLSVVACDGSGGSADSSIPIGVTPPAPPAQCPSPPTAITEAIRAQVSSSQSAATKTRDELLDPSVITVVTCGTGTPIPSSRTQACTAVFVNGTFLLFDAGDGAQRSMESLGLPVTDLTAVFLTHYHSDHIADLGEVVSRSWILGRRGVMPVYGGQAIDRVVEGFNRIYAPDSAYRTAHHGDMLFPPSTSGAEARFILDPGPGGSVVYEQDGVTVTAFQVDHSPVEPALGYRVDFAGKSVAISGDTTDTEGLRNMSEGADVLVSEVMNKAYVEDAECAFRSLGEDANATIFKDIRSYHIDVSEIAELAKDAGVQTLVLTHQVPTVDDPFQIDLVFRAPISAIFGGEVVVAADGTRVVLPVD